MTWQTLIRCAAIFAVILISFLVWVGSHPDRQQQSSAIERYGKQDIVTPAFSRIGNSTLSYRDACQNPKDSNDANLCIQRESLKAYQKQATWAEATFFIGIFGTAAVLATVFYTIKSVRAAERNADAAIASVSTSLEIGRAQVRAYISFTDASVVMKELIDKNEGNYIIPFFNIAIKNFGNSPAIEFSFYTTAVFGGVADIRLRNGETTAHAFGKQNIQASTTATFNDFPILDAKLTGKDIELFHNGEVFLVTTFYTSFIDVFHQTTFGNSSFITSFSRENKFATRQATVSAATAENMARTLRGIKQY